VAVVGDLWFSVRAGAGRDDRSSRSAAERRLAGRSQWRPVDCAGAGARALGAGVASEQVERAALRVDEECCPGFSLATPTVADCPFAVLGGAGERLVLLALLLQPATASATRTGTVALARNVIDLVRVMVAPFVEWVNGSLQRACGPHGGARV
jgi:hypothetical protein